MIATFIFQNQTPVIPDPDRESRILFGTNQ